MTKLPAYQWYPKDAATDEAYKLMTYEQQGIYRALLDHQWLEGSIPAEPDLIARLLPKISLRRFLDLWPGIARQFISQPDGRLVNARLERQRLTQAEFKAGRQTAGQRSAEVRRERFGSAQPQGGGARAALEQASNTCSNTRSNGPPNSFRTGPEHAVRVAVRTGSEPPICSLQTADSVLPAPSSQAEARAGKLRQELYPRWFAKYRHGAKLRLVASSLEFQEALSLVSTWDDATLEKLAAIVLTTDDEWIAGTDRSFRIFALKASWAHDRLAAWEASQRARG